MLQNISNILYIALVVISLLITVVNLIINKVKTARANQDKKDVYESKLIQEQEFQEQLTNEQNLYKVITSILPQAIKLAESNANISGTAKKLIAVSDVIQRCAMEGIDYGGIAKEVDTKLEEMIDLTNTVNVKSNN